MKDLILKLEKEHVLCDDEFLTLIKDKNKENSDFLAQRADKVRKSIYGRDVYIRGLIEFTNYCKNDCRYCGIRKSNAAVQRYRLSKEDILECCKTGYALGFRTFVLQGGEDGFFTDDRLTDIIGSIKTMHSDCAVTLSVGERDYSAYKAFFDAGADRYLLRHETADTEHYSRLHPPNLSLESRMECLYSLKEIGFQVGCGFMVGSPFQTDENLVEDLKFISRFQPHMVGIGPFIPHKDTPFGNYAQGSFELTLKLLSMIRLMLPNVLLPATTALGTVHPNGREMGILVGANVVMPNLSPADIRKNYMLYNNKISTGEEAAESIALLKEKINNIGYNISIGRGDYKGEKNGRKS